MFEYVNTALCFQVLCPVWSVLIPAWCLFSEYIYKCISNFCSIVLSSVFPNVFPCAMLGLNSVNSWQMPFLHHQPHYPVLYLFISRTFNSYDKTLLKCINISKPKSELNETYYSLRFCLFVRSLGFKPLWQVIENNKSQNKRKKMLNTNSLNCVIVAKHIRTLYTAYMLCDDSKLENVTVVTQSACLKLSRWFKGSTFMMIEDSKSAGLWDIFTWSTTFCQTCWEYTYYTFSPISLGKEVV